MRSVPAAALFLAVTSSHTLAQAARASEPDVAILVRGYEVATNGAETSSGVTFSTTAVIGRSARAVFSSRDCGYFAASTNNEFFDNATAGWRVEITPTRVVDQAVTFRLRWSRVIDRTPKSFNLPSEDLELTLKPGESRPLDQIPVPAGAKTFDGRPCNTSRASLRVEAEVYPIEEFERRLMAIDMWLVERLAGGKERTQLVPLRGLPNRSISFYFDSIPDGNNSLDIYGHMLVRLDAGAVDLSLEAISRWGDRSLDARQTPPARWWRSSLRVTPNEVVDVSLPKLGAEAGAFANRLFSLRIRVRQTR